MRPETEHVASVMNRSGPKRLTASFLFLTFCLVFTPSGVALADQVRLRPADNVTKGEIFEELQKQMASESRPETAFEARRQLRRATTLLADLLNSKGYYDPDIQSLVETKDGFKPVIILDPGKRFRLNKTRIEFTEAQPSTELAETLRAIVRKMDGEFAIPANVIQKETELVQRLRKDGYPFASAGDRKIMGDREAGELEVTYQISSGPRVRFGKVVFPDNVKTKHTYLSRLIPFKQGEVYSPEKMSTFGSRLDETRLFSLANAHLSDTPSGQHESGDEIRDIEVTLTERKKNRIEAGINLATDTGFGLSTEFTRRNLSRRGDFLVAGFNISTYEQSLDIKWRRPNEFGYGKNLTFGSSLSNEDTDAYNRQIFTLSSEFENRKNPRRTYGFGVKGSLISEQDEFSERDLQLVSLYAKAGLDRANSVLNATKGWRADGRIEPSLSFGGDETQFIRGSAQLRGYLPLREDHGVVLAGRLRIGSVWGAELEDLPTTSRFFSGGGGSVRGYAYQDIGPLSANNEPIGGKSLLETSIEARWMIRPKISLAGFVDAGNVSTRDVPGVSDMRAGAGFGVRYDTLAGPLRIDIATPLDPTDRDDPVQVYISLGQAF